jgi:hypothetical protein
VATGLEGVSDRRRRITVGTGKRSEGRVTVLPKSLRARLETQIRDAGELCGIGT